MRTRSALCVSRGITRADLRPTGIACTSCGPGPAGQRRLCALCGGDETDALADAGSRCPPPSSALRPRAQHAPRPPDDTYIPAPVARPPAAPADAEPRHSFPRSSAHRHSAARPPVLRRRSRVTARSPGGLQADHGPVDRRRPQGHAAAGMFAAARPGADAAGAQNGCAPAGRIRGSGAAGTTPEVTAAVLGTTAPDLRHGRLQHPARRAEGGAQQFEKTRPFILTCLLEASVQLGIDPGLTQSLSRI